MGTVTAPGDGVPVQVADSPSAVTVRLPASGSARPAPVSPRVLRLPSHGRLLVAADLRGNLRDFEQILAHFKGLGPDAHLLFLGNLIHGPYLPPTQFPVQLGRFYRDESPAILLKLLLLQDQAPGRVHALLGNHEYAHLGGPRTSRFAEDEVEALRVRLGREASDHVEALLGRLPLWALAPCGLLLCHAAPRLEPLDSAQRSGAPSIDSAQRSGAPSIDDLLDRARPGPLLWSPPLPPEQARALLPALGAGGVVFGHHSGVRGAELIGDEQLVLATSFGLNDEDKRVLVLDLSARYASARALRPGQELRPLYD